MFVTLCLHCNCYAQCRWIILPCTSAQLLSRHNYEKAMTRWKRSKYCRVAAWHAGSKIHNMLSLTRRWTNYTCNTLFKHCLIQPYRLDIRFQVQILFGYTAQVWQNIELNRSQFLNKKKMFLKQFSHKYLTSSVMKMSRYLPLTSFIKGSWKMRKNLENYYAGGQSPSRPKKTGSATLCASTNVWSHFGKLS